VIPDWPANSPDLSVIENVWGILKGRVAKRAPKTIPELKTALQEEWDNLDQRMLDDLVASTPGPFRKCIQEHDKSISRLVRNLHPSENQEDPHLPSGLLRIRDLSLTSVGQTVNIAARVRKTHPSECEDKVSWVALEDRKSLMPPGEHSARIGMQAYGDCIQDFAVGARVVLFAKVLAIRTSLIDNLEMVKASLLPMRIYLSFERFDTDHEWEIADSDSEPLPDGSSSE
jgi:hypothetical protein